MRENDSHSTKRNPKHLVAFLHPALRATLTLCSALGDHVRWQRQKLCAPREAFRTLENRELITQQTECSRPCPGESYLSDSSARSSVKLSACGGPSRSPPRFGLSSANPVVDWEYFKDCAVVTQPTKIMWRCEYDTCWRPRCINDSNSRETSRNASIGRAIAMKRTTFAESSLDHSGNDVSPWLPPNQMGYFDGVEKLVRAGGHASSLFFETAARKQQLCTLC